MRRHDLFLRLDQQRIVFPISFAALNPIFTCHFSGTFIVEKQDHILYIYIIYCKELLFNLRGRLKLIERESAKPSLFSSSSRLRITGTLTWTSFMGTFFGLLYWDYFFVLYLALVQIIGCVTKYLIRLTL